MIALIMHREGRLTFNPTLQSPHYRWQAYPLELKDRVTPFGLLFTAERGGFGLLMEELERMTPRDPSDPINGCTASGVIVTGEGKLVSVHWKRFGYTDTSPNKIHMVTLGNRPFFIGEDTEQDEVGGIIMNEKPELPDAEICQLITEVAGTSMVTNMPIETRTLTELAAIYRELTNTEKKEPDNEPPKL